MINKTFFDNIEIDFHKKSKHEIEFLLETISKNHQFCLMSELDKIVLYNIGKLIPDNGVIVEVGSFLGGSASILSSASPKSCIFSIDMFEKKQPPKMKSKQILWSNKINLAFGSDVPRTLDLVQDLNQEYKNVKFLQGCSPKDFSTWNTMVDLYVEDGDHKLPIIKDNLLFWSTLVKPNGLIVCHDYKPFLSMTNESRFVDVETSVHLLITLGICEFICNIGGYAILKKL